AAWGSPATEPPLVAAGGTAARGTPRGHEPAGVAAHPAVSRGSRGRAVTAVLESRRVSQPVRRLTRALGGDGGRGDLATQTIRRPLAVATQLVPLSCRPGGWCPLRRRARRYRGIDATRRRVRGSAARIEPPLHRIADAAPTGGAGSWCDAPPLLSARSCQAQA